MRRSSETGAEAGGQMPRITHGPDGAGIDEALATPGLDAAMLSSMAGMVRPLDSLLADADRALEALDEAIAEWQRLKDKEKRGKKAGASSEELALPEDLKARLRKAGGVSGLNLYELLQLNDHVVSVASKTFPCAWEAHKERVAGGETLQQSIGLFCSQIGGESDMSGPVKDIVSALQKKEREKPVNAGDIIGRVLMGLGLVTAVAGVVALVSGFANVLFGSDLDMSLMLTTASLPAMAVGAAMAMIGEGIGDTFGRKEKMPFDGDRLRRKAPQRAEALDTAGRKAHAAARAITYLLPLTAAPAKAIRDELGRMDDALDEALVAKADSIGACPEIAGVLKRAHEKKRKALLNPTIAAPT